MTLIEKRGASKSDLRWFGLIIAACFGVLGAMSAFRGHHNASRIFWTIGVVLALLYHAIPPVQRMMYDAWMTIFYPIGWAISHLMMVIVFYLVLTPVGLLMRLFGRDPLNRSIDRAAKTYWIEHEPQGDLERYFKQF